MSVYDTSLIRRPQTNKMIARVPLIIFSDDFNRPDGPLGPPNWSNAEAPLGCTIMNHQVGMAGYAGEVLYPHNLPVAAVGMSIEIYDPTPVSGDECDLNFYMTPFDGSLDAGAISALKFVGTNWVFSMAEANVFVTLPGPIAPGAVMSFEIAPGLLPGDKWKQSIYLDGVLIAENPSDFIIQTPFQAGFALNSGNMLVDNFKLYTSQYAIL